MSDSEQPSACVWGVAYWLWPVSFSEGQMFTPKDFFYLPYPATFEQAILGAFGQAILGAFGLAILGTFRQAILGTFGHFLASNFGQAILGK